MQKDSDLEQLVGSTWDGRNVARCNECGVLYDHRFAEGGAEATSSDETATGATAADETVNCPDCGSPNAGDRDTCSYCGSSLES
jgi:hypothetical protein